MKCMIIGASGRLGKAAYSYLKAKWNVIGTYCNARHDDLVHLNVMDTEQLRTLLWQLRPDVILYTAGLVGVEECEEDPVRAYECNAMAINHITCYSDAKLIYISTDYVFDGQSGGYTEDAVPTPINMYGQTKRDGENFTLRHENNVVLRVSRLFDSKAILFDKECFYDDNRLTTPVRIDDVCRAIEYIVNSNACGVFHACSETAFSRYEFAIVNNVLSGSSQTVLPIVYDCRHERIRRPFHTNMKCDRLTALGWRTNTDVLWKLADSEKKRSLLIVNCNGVCLSERTWRSLNDNERAVYDWIQVNCESDDCIGQIDGVFHFSHTYVEACLYAIAEKYTPNPYFWNQLITLKSIYQIALYFTGNSVVFDIWNRKYHLDSIFDSIFYVPEPSHAIQAFQELITRTQSEPGSCYLWDRNTKVVSEAQNVGIITTLFHPSNTTPVDACIPKELNTALQISVGRNNRLKDIL